MHTLPRCAAVSFRSVFQRAGVLCLLALLAVLPARAQVPYDASWYSAGQPYVKIEVAEDALYRVEAGDLAAAGVPLSQIDPGTLRLLEKGREVPLSVSGGGDGGFSSGDALVFAGRRNRGDDEAWAYKDYDLANQSSPYRSLYTDTLSYWLTWGGEAGQRYAAGPGGSGATTTALRDTLHREEDRTFYYAEPRETGDPRYTNDEGYYWTDLDALNEEAFEQSFSLERLAATGDDLRLSVRLVSRTGSCHRVALEVDTGSGFEEVDEAQWRRYDARLLSTQLPQSQIGGALDVRVQSYSDGFDALNNCDPEDPNNVLVDFVEASYVRRLAPAADGQQRFTAASAQPTTFALSGYGDGPVRVFSPAAARRFSLTASGGGASFSDTPAPGQQYWVAAPAAFRTPAGLAYQPPGTRPDWTAPTSDADYLLLTTRALRPSAEQLAAYRESQNGYDVAIVELEDVYDQFDYGRATPIAIRRLVHYSQSQWSGAPDFLTLWGDATYPVYTDTEVPDAPWNVPSFGFAPSDGWYAMQYNGVDDWSEVVAVGRIPLRTAEQASLFLQKLQNYESSTLSDWQKRMLLLSGGTSASEQNRLENATLDWGEVAGNPPSGMDTIYFAKQSEDALDESFQDSLDAAFERGAGWLNYFGHSAAQTWEIVTEEPSEYENADRLPFVVSLGCQTGAFAGGRFESKPAPAFGEKLVIGSLNGSIGHYGTSYLGRISPSAHLDDLLIDRVFEDTVRVVGRAIQQAERISASRSTIGRRAIEHLMQYSLLGDPATRLQIPDRPNLHLEPSQIALAPLAPTPSDSLRATVRLKNQGLVPADSVDLRFTRTDPGGEQTVERRRLAPFPLVHTSTFSTLLTERNVGVNRFRAEADPGDEIAEEREDDNSAEQTQVVFSSGVQLVEPRDLDIAPRRSPTFRLSLTTDADQPPPVRLQLAPTSAFGTLLAEDVQAGSGPLVKWTPDETLDDGATYYWRARLDDADDEDAWRTGSFTVRPDLSDGWLQQDAQFGASAPHTRLERTGGQWAFSNYNVQVLATSERGSGAFKGQFVVNGAQRYENAGLGFGVLIMDGESGQVKGSGSFCTYEVSVELTEQRCEGQVDGAAAIALLQDFIDETLDEGDYLFTRTRHLARESAQAIPESVKDLFRTLDDDGGATYSQALDSLDYRDLWIMQARKGSPGQTTERVAPANDGQNEITYDTGLTFTYPSGQTTSPRIGPAKRWNALGWAQALDGAGDRLRIDVLSGDAEDVLVSDLGGTDAPRDLSGISATEHPYLRLRATLSDSTDRTAPQLQAWHLTYTPNTELAVDPARLALSADTLDEDQQAEASVPVVNLVDRPSEPVRVFFTVTDSSNQTRTVGVDTLGTLGPEEEATASTSFLASLAGDAVLNVRAEQIREGEEVPEPLAFNNTLVKSFFVRGDDTAPNVRVVVDGRELEFDPEETVGNLQDPALPFIALRPTIEIILDDDNAFQTLDDPNLLAVALDDDPVSFESDELEFVPGDAPGDAARAIFTPDFTGQDTVHTLTVEVEDANGNLPDQDFQTRFRVRTEMRVRDLYPYPNPMNTHTNFAFRLEGGDTSDIEELRLRVYTLAGRLVREFDVSENPMLANPERGGGLRPGWNKIPWEGRDADGDRMATGVYLYKVFLNGEGDLDVNDGNVEKITIIH